jgi:3-oxoacyl-[acyl-carrier-protein] synthase I
MMRPVYIAATNVITPMGLDVASNILNIENGISGIQRHENSALMMTPFYAAAIDESQLNKAFAKISSDTDFTKLEKMLLLALHPVVEKANLKMNNRVAFLLSTTKGNITALEEDSAAGVSKAHLHELAKTVTRFFGGTTAPIVISNACVSGILAVAVAKRMIQSQMYDHVFVVAGDLVSEFVLSGFNSFQAMSDSPCKPYSNNRTGVNLGEAAAAVLVTSDKNNAMADVLGDGSINDANHISGPSRTGEGLYRSIQNAFKEADVNANQIDYISAHGTATPFNDEMEAIAFNRLGLEKVPVNSLKGYYGHTLGASGLLETVIGIESMLQNKVFASMGFDAMGVSQPIAVIEKTRSKNIHYFLKTASGFGGCNTAVVFKAID